MVRRPPIRPAAWLVALLLFARTSRADPPSADATAPTGCAIEDDVERRVTELVGPKAPKLGRAEVHADPIGDGRYRVAVSVSTARGPATRQFESANCVLATDIAALLVAISLYPERSSEIEARAHAAAPENAARTAEPSVPATPILAPDTVVPRADDASRPHPYSLSAALMADMTSMPSAALGGGVIFGLHPRNSLRLEAAVGIFASQTSHLADGRSAEFAMQSAALRGCWGPLSTGAFSACIGALGIRLTGRGGGVEAPHDATAWYVGPSAGAVVRLAAGRAWTFRGSLDAFVPLAAHRFLLAGVEVHQPGAVGVAGQFGPELSF